VADEQKAARRDLAVERLRLSMAESRIVEEDGVEDGDMLSVEQEALLLRQCRLNKVELIERMLDSGKIKVNFFFSNGDNILIVASKCGFKKLVVSYPPSHALKMCRVLEASA